MKHFVYGCNSCTPWLLYCCSTTTNLCVCAEFPSAGADSLLHGLWQGFKPIHNSPVGNSWTLLIPFKHQNIWGITFFQECSEIVPAVCKLPALEHKNWFDSYSTGQELQVWPLAIVTSGYLLPLKFVTTFFIKTKRGLTVCSACFETSLAAPAASSVPSYSCEGSIC